MYTIDDRKRTIRVLSLGILCFQGFGIRIFEGVFDGAIILWTVILFLLNINNVLKLSSSALIKFATFLLFYFIFCTIKSVKPTLFLLGAWTSALIVLSNYWNGKNSFVEDMSKFTQLCVYYSILHIPIMLLLKPYLITTSFGMNPKTFLYLFYFNNGEGLMGLPRIQGFCWEPSCWNLLLNINLLFSLVRKSYRNTVLSVIAIVSVMATTGLVVMIVVILLYYLLYSTNKRQLLKNILGGVVLSVILIPFVYGELSEKLNTGSGAARFGDFAIMATIIKDSPFLGADLDNITQNNKAMNARMSMWNVNGDFDGYMEQGMVNSFAALVVEWGLPLFAVIVFCLLKSPLIPNIKLRILFMVCLCFVLMGTPISRTGFFYMFVFSSLIGVRNYISTFKQYAYRNNRITKKNSKGNENINHHRHIQRRQNAEKLS